MWEVAYTEDGLYAGYIVNKEIAMVASFLDETEAEQRCELLNAEAAYTNDLEAIQQDYAAELKEASAKFRERYEGLTIRQWFEQQANQSRWED